MLSACASFGIIIINSPPLKVPFGNNEGAVTFLFPTFGWAWWLTLWTGIATVALAIQIWVLNYFMPRRIATVFHHSVVEEDEFFQVSEERAHQQSIFFRVSVCVLADPTMHMYCCVYIYNIYTHTHTHTYACN